MNNDIYVPLETHRLVKLSGSTVTRLERAGLFPKHIQLSANRIGYIASEVNDWIAARAADRTAKTAA